jgi:hypothetical protein
LFWNEKVSFFWRILIPTVDEKLLGLRIILTYRASRVAFHAASVNADRSHSSSRTNSIMCVFDFKGMPKIFGCGVVGFPSSLLGALPVPVANSASAPGTASSIATRTALPKIPSRLPLPFRCQTSTLRDGRMLHFHLHSHGSNTAE